MGQSSYLDNACKIAISVWLIAASDIARATDDMARMVAIDATTRERLLIARDTWASFILFSSSCPIKAPSLVAHDNEVSELHLVLLMMSIYQKKISTPGNKGSGGEVVKIRV